MPSPLAVVAALCLAAAEPDIDEEVPQTPPRAGKPVEGRLVESLVLIEAPTVTMESDDLVGAPRDDISGVIAVSAELSHEFDGTVRDLEFDVALMSRPDLEFVWGRLHTSPLRLTTEEVERRLPYPITVLALPSEDTALARGAVRDIALRESFASLPLPRDGSLAYLGALSGYAIDAPSERDVLRIVEAGGPADLAALAVWAAAAAVDGSSRLEDDACGRIMDAVETDVRRLRAPPAFGDFQRLNALTAIALVCARPRDLERMLALQRPMTILLSAAQVSYETAAGEEAILGVSVHGFRRLQSRSDSAVAWENGLRRLRLGSLDRLVRLAFEPVDFRDAPAHMRRHPVLQIQAAQLLQPLSTTEVERVVAAAAERPEMQRELLRFYVEVRHAAAVEPLVEWLVTNPRHVDDLGNVAIGEIGDRMLPVLMRRFGDVDATMAERAATWRLLAALPERHAAQLAALSQSSGIDVAADAGRGPPTVATLLAAIRAHEQRATEDRIRGLVAQLAQPGDNVAALRQQIVAARLLGELAPDRARAMADALIRVHVAAARAFGDELPAERRGALRQLGELPLAEHLGDATRSAATTDAEITAARGEFAAALAQLEAFDPALGHPDLRAQYIDILSRHADGLQQAAAWTELEQLLDRADTIVPGALDVQARRADLEQARRRPLYVIGAIAGVAALVLLVAVLHTFGVLAAAGRWLRALLRRRAATHDPAQPDDDGVTDDVDGSLDADDHRAQDDRESFAGDSGSDHARSADIDIPDGGALGGRASTPPTAARIGTSDPHTGELLGDSWSDEARAPSPLDDFAA